MSWHGSRQYRPDGGADHARERHALLAELIEGDPGHPALASPAGQPNHHGDPSGDARLKRQWGSKLAIDPAYEVLRNAAKFNTHADPQLAEATLRRWAEAFPQHVEPKKRLAQFLMLDSRAGVEPLGAAARERAAEALALLQEVKRHTPATQAVLVVQEIAEAALAAGEDDVAREAAERLLDPGFADPQNAWNAGNRTFDAHHVLGHLALRRGDPDAAATHLRAAGETIGSPQLNSFGPDLSLADALLQEGRRDEVVGFLRDIGAFWNGRDEKIGDWIALIEAGRTPRLSRVPRPGP